jgi:GAF domain-containing protein
MIPCVPSQDLCQAVTDTATRLSGAEFGAFFYNVLDSRGESYMLYTPHTSVFAPTFRGEGVVRSTDIIKDPRFGKNDPYFGMPKGHLSVCSYLAGPVVSRGGEVLGGLFFGHPEPGEFDARAERIVSAIAIQGAIARAADQRRSGRTQTRDALLAAGGTPERRSQTLIARCPTPHVSTCEVVCFGGAAVRAKLLRRTCGMPADWRP